MSNNFFIQNHSTLTDCNPGAWVPSLPGLLPRRGHGGQGQHEEEQGEEGGEQGHHPALHQGHQGYHQVGTNRDYYKKNSNKQSHKYIYSYAKFLGPAFETE